jgi:Big-like domain-containing protein/WD40 repeat protein
MSKCWPAVRPIRSSDHMRTAHQVKLRLALAGLLVLGWVWACSDTPGGLGSGIVPPPVGLVVSDPSPVLVVSAGGNSLIYVSLSPGTVPNGVRATVRNPRSGSAVEATLLRGGFDPVALAAQVGDTVEVVVRDAAGTVVVQARTVVALARRPRVVRTDPPPRKRDVPLNSAIVIVFSEPIAGATLTGAAVQLLQGTAPIAGQLQFLDPDHVIAAFVPASLLAPTTTYELVVTQRIRDLDGDSLEVAVTVEFTTEEPPTTPAPLTTQVTAVTKGGALDPNGYSVMADQTCWGTSDCLAGGGFRSVALPVNGTVTTAATGSPTYSVLYLVRLLDVAANCNVIGPNPRIVPLGSVVFEISCDAITQLAFADTVDGNADIYVINSDGTGRTRLTSNAARDMEPTWSPDGSKIAFTSDRDGNAEIYVMNADGSNPLRLTNAAGWDYRPDWSPDGTKIAFTTDRDGYGAIYAMNADGTNQVSLSPGADPAWSPDGTKIAFEGYGIYVMNADGSDVRQLTTPGDYPDADPAWSPDGTWIAFSRGVWNPEFGPTSVVVIMSADGSGGSWLTAAEYHTDPAWYPDGSKIAFVSRDPYSPNGLILPVTVLIMRLDGSERWTGTPFTSGFDPAWRR